VELLDLFVPSSNLALLRFLRMFRLLRMLRMLKVAALLEKLANSIEERYPPI
jgi:hypothetical protein